MYRKYMHCCLAVMMAIGFASLPISLRADDPTTSSPVGPEETVDSADTPDTDTESLYGTPERAEKERLKIVNDLPPDDGSPRGPGSDSCATAAPAVDGLNPFDTTLATPDGPSHDAGDCQFASTRSPWVRLR